MIVIVGCGLSGAVLAERFANEGKEVLIIEKRDHIGGNCYDYTDEESKILINKYGAHIFHTNCEEVYKYITKFDEWIRYDHKVVAKIEDKYINLPININTINKLFNENLTNEDDMKKWIDTKKIILTENPKNGEELILAKMGVDLYEKIFKYYTKKQWNKFPSELNPSVLNRIPLRYNFDDRYFTDKYQLLPKYGYTHFFNKILDNKRIKIMLNTDFFNIKDKLPKFEMMFYTGPIDHYYSCVGLPKLEYRSIIFNKTVLDNSGYYQPNAVVNYPQTDVNYTRIVEYKHFYNTKSEKTVIINEISTEEGEPYYPVPTEDNMKLFEKYKLLSEKENNIIFVGRLANYKYFNMDETIKNSLDIYKKYMCA